MNESRSRRRTRNIKAISLVSAGWALTYLPIFDRSSHCHSQDLNPFVHVGSYYPISIAILLFRVLLVQVGVDAVTAIRRDLSSGPTITGIVYEAKMVGESEPYRQQTVRLPRAAEEVDGDEGPLARWAPQVSRYCNLLVIAVCATGVLFYLDQSYFENLARCGCGWASHPRDACRSAAASLHPMTFSSLYVLHSWDRVFAYWGRDSGDNYAVYALASAAVVALTLRLSVRTHRSWLRWAALTTALLSVACGDIAWTATLAWARADGVIAWRFDGGMLIPAYANLTSMLLALVYVVSLLIRRGRKDGG